MVNASDFRLRGPGFESQSTKLFLLIEDKSKCLEILCFIVVDLEVCPVWCAVYLMVLTVSLTHVIYSLFVLKFLDPMNLPFGEH